MESATLKQEYVDMFDDMDNPLVIELVKCLEAQKISSKLRKTKKNKALHQANVLATTKAMTAYIQESNDTNFE